FTGYGRHTAALIWAITNRAPWVRSLGASVLGKFSSSSIFSRRLHRLGALLSMEQDEMLADGMSYSTINAERRRILLAPGVAEAMPADGIAEGIRNSLDATRGRHPVERFLDLELNGFLPDHNLNYTDKMAMQAGVEVRVPLVDHRLVEFAMQIPLSAKISLRETKKILRASQRVRLPTDVLTRPKQGFGVPVRHWLQGEARDLLEDLTSPVTIASRGLFNPDAVTALKSDFQASRVDAAFTLFPIMAIELWCRSLESAETVPT
ncbi:MAG: asparagine synthase C-terminal domain-containing protein, partial [Pseudomonadota bacterium]|nr:asparagine synthase C-terminal domain-containing protein [Pseudomonadota bacterium]